MRPWTLPPASPRRWPVKPAPASKSCSRTRSTWWRAAGPGWSPTTRASTARASPPSTSCTGTRAWSWSRSILPSMASGAKPKPGNSSTAGRTRAPGCRSIPSTERPASRRRRCWRASRCSSSTSRISARATIPTSTPWRLRWRRPERPGSPSWCSTGPTRSGASRCTATCWTPRSRPSWACTPSPCGTG